MAAMTDRSTAKPFGHEVLVPAGSRLLDGRRRLANASPSSTATES